METNIDEITFQPSYLVWKEGGNGVRNIDKGIVLEKEELAGLNKIPVAAQKEVNISL